MFLRCICKFLFWVDFKKLNGILYIVGKDGDFLIIFVGIRRVIMMVRWGRGIFEIGFVCSGFLIKYCSEFKKNKYC